MKGRVSGIFLIFCLVVPITATFVVLHYQKNQVRHEVKDEIRAGLSKEELVLLPFSVKDAATTLIWKHGKEFEFKGEMYDIVETEIKGDMIYYWCWEDKKESKLNIKLNRLVALALGQNPERKSTQEQLSNFYKSLFYVEAVPDRVFEFELNKSTFCYTFSRASFAHSPPVPPPELS